MTENNKLFFKEGDLLKLKNIRSYSFLHLADSKTRFLMREELLLTLEIVYHKNFGLYSCYFLCNDQIIGKCLPAKTWNNLLTKISK